MAPTEDGTLDLQQLNELMAGVSGQDGSNVTPEMMVTFCRQQLAAHIDAADPDQVLAMTSVGMAGAVWRNSPVEARHGSPAGPDDTQMMRLNVWMTKRFRFALATEGTNVDALIAAATDDVETPVGQTLRDVVGPQWGEYEMHAEGALEAAGDMTQLLGDDWFALRFGSPMLLFPWDWWGTPWWWSHTVDLTVDAIGDRDGPLWQQEHRRDALERRPDSMGDERLRGALIAGMDTLTYDEAHWLRACTGYSLLGRRARELWDAPGVPAGNVEGPVTMWEVTSPSLNDVCPCGSEMTYRSCHGR